MLRRLLFLAPLALAPLFGPGCHPPPGQGGGVGSGDGAARITVVALDVDGRVDRRRVADAVDGAARSVQCGRVVGTATLIARIGNDGRVARLDMPEESGGLYAGRCVIPQLREALSGAAPAGTRLVIRIRAD